MRKKVIALFLALATLFPVFPVISQAAGKTFSKIQAYTPGQFSDVAETSWYSAGVKTAYEYGIMQGTGKAFGSTNSLSIAETIAMAARLHSLYYTGADTFEKSSPWYQVYVDYTLENKIIAQPYSDYNQPISRSEFVSILYNALPAEALEKINDVEDDAIPDVSMNALGAVAIYDFYRAGILTGSDSKGNFQPSTNIDRAAVATIIARVVEPSLRQKITLQIPKVILFSEDSDETLSVPIASIEYYLERGWNTLPRDFNKYDFSPESIGDYKHTMTWGYGNGILTIWGAGEITYDSDLQYVGTAHPWNPKDKIHTLYITRGVSLEGQAFGLTMKNISDDIGEYKSLTRVELPDTLTMIPNAAFNGCHLTRIGIPESVTFIYDTDALGNRSRISGGVWQVAYQDMVIYCVPGSAASEFASKYDIEQVAATQVFYPDGRTCMVSAKEKSEYLANGWYERPIVGIYSEDGQTQVVSADKVSNYESQGWYTNLKDICTTVYSEAGKNLQIPKGLVSTYEQAGWHQNEEDAKITLYALDGRNITVWKNQIAEYVAVGWYTQPMTTLYAADGQTLIVATADVSTYEATGWSRDVSAVYTTMYALDGRTQNVPNEQIAANQAVGWYLYSDYVCTKADITASESGYADAVTYIETVMIDNANESYYFTLASKRNDLCSAWQKSIGCPIAFLGNYITYNSIGVPEVNVLYRNLTSKTISAFEFQFTCIDAYGNVTTDWTSLYNGTVKVHSDRENLPPYGLGGGSTTLYSNERTTSIQNLRVVRIAFSDGSTWGK